MKISKNQINQSQMYKRIVGQGLGDTPSALIEQYIALAGGKDFHDLISEMTMFESVVDSK